MKKPDLSDNGPYATPEDEELAREWHISVREVRAQRAAEDLPPTAGEAAHTPIPWEEDPADASAILANGPDMDNVLEVCRISIRGKRKQPTRAFIVRACNENEPLHLAILARDQTIRSLERGQNELVKQHAGLVAIAQKRHDWLADNEADMQAEGEWGDAEQDELEALSAALKAANA